MDKELQEVSNTMATVEEKIMRFFKISLPYIVLTVSVLLTIAKSFFSLGFANPFTPQFWIDLALNICTTMATYIVFCIHGNDEYKATSISYKNNLLSWGKYSTEIRKTYAIQFTKYCQEYAKKCAENKRRRILEKSTLYSWEEFTEKFASIPLKELKGHKKSGDISNADYKAFLKARKPIKPPHISATAILCGSNSVSVENIASAKRNYVAQSIIARPFSMLLFSAGFAIITPTFLGLPVASVIFSIVTSCFMILLSAITGNTAGNNGARREAGDVTSRIFFLDTFLNANNIKIEQ